MVALPKRLVGARWLTTFFCGWKRMMCSLGAKRQPSTTEPLRLTDTHMVVVCTCGGTSQVSLSLRPGPGPRKPRPGCEVGCRGYSKHPTLGLGPFTKSQRVSRKSDTDPASAPMDLPRETDVPAVG